jgi:hypothetical protein
VNGFRFHTTAYEESRPNRSTTNSGVVMIDTDGKEYHGRVLEIYELSFYGTPHLKPVIFKCHWLDPERTRRTPTIGLVEVRPDSVYPRSNVYIVAQQAIRLYYLATSGGMALPPGLLAPITPVPPQVFSTQEVLGTPVSMIPKSF